MIAKGSGTIILDRERRILLILRKNSRTFNGTWSNPGGGALEGETQEQTATRETLEEIGVRTRIIRKIADHYHYSERGELIGIFGGFLAEIVRGTPYIREPDKIERLDYFTRRDLPSNLADYTRTYINSLTQEEFP